MTAQTTPAPRDGLLDVVRGAGMTSVILFHVIHGIMRFAPAEDIQGVVDRLPWWLNFAWQPLGLDAIFVISTYLLTATLIAEIQSTGKISYRNFLVRRMSRVVPLYYIAVLLYGLSQGNSAGEIVLALAFVQFLLTGEAVVPVGWSMEVMILVYLALPFVVGWLWHARRPLLWLALAIAVLTLARLIPLCGEPEISRSLFTHLLDRGAIYPQATALYFAPWFRLAPFVFGIGLAFIKARHLSQVTAYFAARTAQWTANLTGILLCALGIMLPVQRAESWLYQVTPDWFWLAYWTASMSLFSLGLSIVLLARMGRQTNVWGPWHSLSQNIMGIYLFHMPMILIGAVIVFRTDDATVLGTATVWHVLGIFAIAFALSAGLAALLYRWVERPLQLWLRRRFLKDAKAT